MAIIRTTKPQSWLNEELGTIPRDARLLFIGLWNLSDDQGVFEWKPGEVLHIRVKDPIDGTDGFTLWVIREKKGKNTKQERLPIPQELGRILKDYCQAAKAAGLQDWQRVHPHQFRHSFIYSKVSQGTYPLILAQMVGHSSLTGHAAVLSAAGKRFT